MYGLLIFAYLDTNLQIEVCTIQSSSVVPHYDHSTLLHCMT